jgi:hypothetical protein
MELNFLKREIGCREEESSESLESEEEETGKIKVTGRRGEDENG